MLLKDKVNELIKNGKISETINLLLKYADDIDKDVVNTIYLISAQFSSNETDYQKNLISSEVYRREKAKITNAIIQLVNDFEPKTLKTEVIEKEAEKEPTSLFSQPKLPESDSMERKYKLPNIQKLLVNALDDTELNQLCMFYFEDVYNSFADGQSKTQKIMKLLDYCKRNMKFQYLLDNVYEQNTSLFELYKPYF